MQFLCSVIHLCQPVLLWTAPVFRIEEFSGRHGMVDGRTQEGDWYDRLRALFNWNSFEGQMVFEERP
jgi:hypothetical protein